MEDYYEHKCDKMKALEILRDYGNGWTFEQNDNRLIDNIDFCPRCGVNLDDEFVRQENEKKKRNELLTILERFKNAKAIKIEEKENGTIVIEAVNE